MKRIASVVALAAVVGTVFATTARAQLVMQMGNNWNLSLSGNVNGFYVEQWGPIATPAVAGSAVSNAAGTTGNIRTGLLPADINFAAKGHEGNLDIGVFFGFYPQIQNGGAVGNNHDQFGAQIDMRQVFLTIGNASWGQIEVGRDLGLFNRHNILTDATLFGVGATGGNLGAGGTTLGRIGFGYIYPNFNAQITYSTPAGKPLQWSIGIFQPSGIGASTPGAASGVADNQVFPYTPLPRIETEVTWTGNIEAASGDMAAKTVLLWVNAEWQDAKSTPAGLSGTIDTLLSKTINAGGLGLGGKLDLGDWSFVGSGYWGRGIGTTLQFSSIGVDGDGGDRTSYGYIGQITWKFSGKWSLTGSYGESFVQGTNFDKLDATYPALLKYNSAAVGGLIYQWTKSVKYVVEYGYDAAANVGGGKDISNSLSTGFMLFF
jgi:hypothetical protein